MNTDTSMHDRRAAKSIKQGWRITRRVFLKSSVASLTALSLSCEQLGGLRAGPGPTRFGIVTDCHYADADTMGTRFYRESLDKLGECIDLMNAEKVDFLIELGDFKDQGKPAVERDTLSYLEAVEKVFCRFDGPRYHVLGNHDMDSLSKKLFLGIVENTGIASGRSYYSFDVNHLHCVVLDANYRTDGADYDHGDFDWTDANIPTAELAWLVQDLAAASNPVIIFNHQLFDGTGSVYVKNAGQVRNILEGSGKVLAVFHGHHHPGSYNNIAGIHYYTLKALVEGSGPENNSYAIVDVHLDGDIIVTGYRKAVSKKLDRV